MRYAIAPIYPILSYRLQAIIGISKFATDLAAENIRIQHAALCQQNPLLSPGDHLHLLDSYQMPVCPTLVLYGSCEALANQSRSIGSLADSKSRPHVYFVVRPTVHVWPMSLFHLGKDEDERGDGLREISEWLVRHQLVEVD